MHNTANHRSAGAVFDLRENVERHRNTLNRTPRRAGPSAFSWLCVLTTILKNLIMSKGFSLNSFENFNR